MVKTPTDSARLWQADLPGLELFQAQLFHHRFNKHFHESYTIGLNEAGRGCSQHRGENQVHYPGSFKLINPGDMHTGQVASAEGWTFRNLYIDLSLVEQVLAQLEWPRAELPYFVEPVTWAPDLTPLFHQLFDALNTPNGLLRQQSLLLDLLSHLFRHYAERPVALKPLKPESKAIQQARTYLEAHYAQNISIETLAQQVNLSPYYLIRSFRQQVGCPPHHYQRHWQLKQVKQALRTGEPLAVIAAEQGFYDQSHLNRVFKQTFGVTPGQYQKGNSVQYA
ncbi:MAG: AraC family transcriptional regulator [Leptolyngbyaceae cyanobacterium]